MDFKFTITCKSCGCRTELKSGKWEHSNCFQCPNCKTEMPKDMFSTLCNAVSALDCVVSDEDIFSISLGDCFSKFCEK